MNTKNMTDMTNGSPIKHIFRFAWPLLIGNLFQQLYNMVDSLIVGRFVGANALAAVGTCGSMNFLFFSLSIGLGMGIGILVSQYFGAKQQDMVGSIIGNSIYVLGSVAIVVSILGILISPWLLRLLATPERIIGDSIIYMRMTCIGMIPIAVYNGVTCIVRALGDSKTPLYFLILSSIVNVILDLVFVLTLGWGVFGVAFATVIAQSVAAVTSVIYAYVRIPYFRLRKEQMKPRIPLIMSSVKLGIPVALQNSMIAISCMALQGIVNQYGETVMAAYTITGRIEQIVQQPYGSLGMALTTYSGQNMGAKKLERVKQGYNQAVIIALVFSLCMIPIAYIFGRQIIEAFVKEPEVIEIGISALRITSLCYFGLGMIYVPRAVLNGCGDTGFAMLNGFTEVVCRLTYSQIFTRIPVLGFWGIWVTTGATWITTAIVCVIRYVRGRWKMKGVIQEEKVQTVG